MHTKNEVLAEALNLPPIERAQLIEDLLTSFESPDRDRLDRLWAAEAEDRVEAFKQGKFEAIPMEKVFAKINR
ncbi:MAG: addiction module protein [Geobacteraceae bacterium]